MARKGLMIFLASVCLASLLVAMSIVGVCDSARAEKSKVIHWKFSSYEPPISLYLEAQKWWIDQVEKRSKGRLKIKLYTLNQLCSPKEMCEAGQTGLADVAMICQPYFPGKTPLGTLQYVPFVAPRRIDHQTLVWNELSDNPLFVKEMAKWNCVFGFYLGLNQYNIMSRKPIKTVKDFKGLKIRALGDQAALFKAVGAIPISVTAPEIYTTMERGLMDAVPGCGEWFFSNWRVFDACHNCYYIKGIDMQPAGVLWQINKQSWDKLPADIQKVIDDLKWEMPAIVHELHDSKGVKEYFMKKFKKAGIKLSYLPASERAKLTAHAPAIWKAWKERYKKDGSYEFFDAFMKAKEKVLKEYPNGVYKDRPLPERIKKVLHKL